MEIRATGAPRRTRVGGEDRVAMDWLGVEVVEEEVVEEEEDAPSEEE